MEKIKNQFFEIVKSKHKNKSNVKESYDIYFVNQEKYSSSNLTQKIIIWKN